MSEARRRRRAEERAEAKRVKRSGHAPSVPSVPPVPSLPSVRPERFYDVELYRIIDDEVPEGDPDRGPWWGAECGLRDDSSGVDIESGLSLQAVIDDVVTEARRWTNRYRIRIHWSLSTDSGDLAAIIAEEGVELPESP